MEKGIYIIESCGQRTSGVYWGKISSKIGKSRVCCFLTNEEEAFEVDEEVNLKGINIKWATA